ncbi:hypothetical protein PMNALOAF_2732 [Methylobacterium adhaesivum]|uniref:Uncharacterized protein n=1 Tax=Methylobacterium adhaesivum TaxID=333297 RepID=A0ABT8BKR0_9HYPH|nr:hypothetical protein [Methylobacterium adhaesivum]MDN3592087.1 hypothetical protein [Methylobacterium adhaesivum]GJD31473.1 hypothetical protein PMNALOAF_2732 [Methylobacterium adhaesivum]
MLDCPAPTRPAIRDFASPPPEPAPRLAPPAPQPPAITAPEPRFAIIRGRILGEANPETMGPAWIVRIDREAPKSLIGFLLNEHGEPDVIRVSLYDRSPNVFGQHREPGRFEKRREIARFDSFEQARFALVAGRAGWDSASLHRLEELKVLVEDRKKVLTAERARLIEAVNRALGPMTKDLNDALASAKAEAERVVNRRNALMRAAIEPRGSMAA